MNILSKFPSLSPDSCEQMMISEGEDDGQEMITGNEKCGELRQAEDEDRDDVADAAEADEAARGHLDRYHLHQDDIQQHHGNQGQPGHQVDHQQVQDETKIRINLIIVTRVFI